MENVEQKIQNLLSNPLLPPSAKSFILSLKSWNERKGLTNKQVAALNVIEARYDPSKAMQNIDESWQKKYNNNTKMKEDMLICAKFYEANPPYYSDLVFRTLNEKEFVPTEKQFNALTNNRYTNKVLTAHHKKPDFCEGSYVYIRKTANYELLNEISNRPCLVLQADASPIVHARKGAKVYKIIPFGISKIYFVEERDIKKANIKIA